MGVAQSPHVGWPVATLAGWPGVGLFAGWGLACRVEDTQILAVIPALTSGVTSRCTSRCAGRDPIECMCSAAPARSTEALSAKNVRYVTMLGEKHSHQDRGCVVASERHITCSCMNCTPHALP